MNTHIVCLEMAANCCRECLVSKEESTKSLWKKKITDHFEKAAVYAKDAYYGGELSGEECTAIMRFIVENAKICQTCGGKEGFLFPMIEKKMVEPYKSADVLLDDLYEEGFEAKKERPKVKGVKKEGNLFRYNFRKKKREKDKG